MSRTSTFKERLRAGERIVGSFVRTPVVEMVEILALAGLDTLCLDAEHGPFDRGTLGACLAVGRALDMPMLVRVPSGAPDAILSALDAGAVGVMVPHVDSPEKAAAVALAARYGRGGRGYAGGTRWSSYGGAMADLLAQSAAETVLVAQIEEPEGVEAASAIAGTDGIDALFIGPSDLSVSMGVSGPGAPELAAAFDAVGAACRAAGRGFGTWTPDAERARAVASHGVSLWITGSEQSWVLSGARTAAEALRAL